MEIMFLGIAVGAMFLGFFGGIALLVRAARDSPN
jgi:hypothetical protein